MTTRRGATAWTGVGAGAGVVLIATALLHRTLTITRVIGRYADDIAAVSGDVVSNTDVGTELRCLCAAAKQVRVSAGAGRAEAAGAGT